MNKSAYILALFLTVCSIRTIAQTDSTNSVYHESVIVVGDYHPVLDGVTEKVNVAPATNDNIATEMQPKFDYSITPRRISSLTPTSGIKAAKVVGSPTKLYNNYMRFGLGHDFASFGDFEPLVDLHYMSTRNDNLSYGARLFHNTDFSTYGKKDEDTPSADYYGRNRESETMLSLFGKYILNKKHLFSADLAFDRQYGRYYGFSDSTLFSIDGITHDDLDYSLWAFAYNNIALNLGASSLHTDVNKFGYAANVGLANMWTKYDRSQQSMELDGNVHYGFPMFRKYKAVAYLHGNWQGYKQHLDVPNINGQDAFGRHVLTINPYVDFLFRDFKFHAGLAFGFNGYDNDQETSHNLFPDITVSKSFMNNMMSLTCGFMGGYIVNDWNSTRLYNPYIIVDENTCATVDDNLYAHLRFNFSKKLILNVTVDNHFYRSRMFFMTDRLSNTTYGNIMTPYFMDVNNLDLGADFTFVNDEMIRMTLGGNYYVYYNKQYDNIPLFHTPDFIAHFDVDVNYKDKWFFDLRTLFITSVDAYYTENATGLVTVTDRIPARFGLSLGAEYKYNRALSFFTKLDNVTCQRYFLWANYPSTRLNAMIGLTYTFPKTKK